MIKNYKDMLHIVSTNSKQQQIVDARPPNLFNSNILSEQFPVSREMTPHLMREMPHMSQKTPHPLRKMPHLSRETPHLLPKTSHLSRGTPHALREMPHLSRGTPHPLREIPHVSRETPHVSREMRWYLQNSGYCCYFFIHLLNYKIKDSFRF
jgi:hypothetical protein